MAYSVKPGRGPSLMGGVSSLAAAGFGVLWTVFAANMGAPWPFTGFGIIFIFLSLAGAAYHFFNVGSRNRMSSFDIATPGEERDPISHALGYEKELRPGSHNQPSGKRKIPGDFCPYCGQKVEAHFDFCPQCGKDI